MKFPLQRVLSQQLLVFCFFLFGSVLALQAQPTVKQQMPSGTIVTGSSATSIHLINFFQGGTGGLTYSATTSSAAAVAVEVASSTLTLKPVAAGNSTITVRATDANNAFVEANFSVTVVSSPRFTTHPASKSVTFGGGTTLSVAASGAAVTYQWAINGSGLTITDPNLEIAGINQSLTGIYTAYATSGGVTVESNPAIVGVSTSDKVKGGGSEVGTDILHPNGNTFDQILLEGSSVAFTSEYAKKQITRLSFIDLSDDIVQIEYSGPGTVSVVLAGASGPALPKNYNQDQPYWKGHASITIVGATENSNLSVFTVGRATAFDITGAFNILAPVSATNDPSKNGSPLFAGHATTNYDGVADIARISIRSTDGKFGGIRTSNTYYYDYRGLTGIYAPGVAFQGPVYIGNISSYEAATSAIVLGSVAGETRITGGDLLQANGQPIEVNGLTQLKFTAGATSHGDVLPALQNRGILHRNGQNVTTQIVVNP